MPQVHVIVASAEEADEGIAEFWCAGEMVAETVIHEGQLRRPDRPPHRPRTMADRGLEPRARARPETERRLAAY